MVQGCARGSRRQWEELVFGLALVLALMVGVASVAFGANGGTFG